MPVTVLITGTDPAPDLAYVGTGLSADGRRWRSILTCTSFAVSARDTECISTVEKVGDLRDPVAAGRLAVHSDSHERQRTWWAVLLVHPTPPG
ncbi:hypothetical protein GCM10027614_28560 [Micromonospora vulcania]